MKKLLLCCFLLAPFFLSAQPADSAAVASRVDSLIKIAAPLIGQRKFDDAKPNIESAKKLALEKFGASHPAFASCLFQEARIFHNTNKAADAERLYLEVKAIRELSLGKDHLDYAAVLGNLGILYVRLNRFEEAEQCHLEAKATREKKLGKDHPDYIGSLNNLGSVYYRSGRADEAEQAYLEVKAWREKNLGKEHIEYARILSNLANLYSDFMGRYEEAGRYYAEVLTIQEKSPGKESADYGFTLSYLGDMYRDLGRYEEAEKHLLEAKSVLEKVFGKEHIEYAACLERLANLNYTLGRFEAAEPLYIEVQAIREKSQGKEHPDYGAALNNRAVLYMATQRFPAADSLYLEAKTIQENKQEKDSVSYAWVLNNLGILYTKMGRFGAADSMLLRAKIIREKTVGKTHPDYANTLEDLAFLYEKMGKPAAALPLQKEALAIFEKTLGKSHDRYAKNLNSLSGLQEKLGKPDVAEPLFLEANALRRNLVAKTTRYASERDIAAFANLFVKDLDKFFSFAQRRQSASPTLAAASFDNALFHKGFLLTAAARVRNLALSDTLLAKRFEHLTAFHRLLAIEYAKPVAERNGVEGLETKANQLERELTQATAGLADAWRQIGWKEVQANLKPGEAAVEFIHFRPSADSVLYAALILQAGIAPPQWVSLFEEKSLDSLFRLHGVRRSDYVSDLYTYAERGAVALGKPKKTLYELAWQPLEKSLVGVQTVYLSPAGLLHRINLGAIPLGLDETVADRYRLVELGSTRQLAVPSEIKIAANDALLFGAVQYEMDSLAITQANQDFGADLIASRSRSSSAGSQMSFSQADSTSRGRGWKWQNLLWTEKEVNGLESILTTGGIEPNVRRGFSATEDYFKNIGTEKPSPRVLHLATHGYFFETPSTQPRDGGSEQESIFKISDHPMIRSGLILAGGNHAWATGKSLLPDMEDGILTAYEISQMNLSGTELVVLSACETGLGDLQGSEGVYGLQRAFKIAGVKYLVMSLWQVPDKKTSVLMTTFYKKWLEEKMTIPDAFHAAQKERREAGDDAFDWAGFVLLE